MATAEPTPFAAEGPCRHGIRSALCLNGWRWGKADAVAAYIVADALDMIGARRPSWPEGQPEWTQPGALPIERERCVRCHKPLPEGHRLYCSKVCASAYKADRYRREDREAANAKARAWRAAWSAKQPEQPCEACGRMFRPNQPGQRFCSIRCRNTHNASLKRALA